MNPRELESSSGPLSVIHNVDGSPLHLLVTHRPNEGWMAQMWSEGCGRAEFFATRHAAECAVQSWFDRASNGHECVESCRNPGAPLREPSRMGAIAVRHPAF